MRCLLPRSGRALAIVYPQAGVRVAMGNALLGAREQQGMSMSNVRE